MFPTSLPSIKAFAPLSILAWIESPRRTMSLNFLILDPFSKEIGILGYTKQKEDIKLKMQAEAFYHQTVFWRNFWSKEKYSENQL